ncbi:Zinc finger, DHHC-type, palmitoyltransferase [Ceraceosorus bombacis]|uniref:Zinc finger, DHHC-type, palmitoyltransferase n=1 Tax=Ceraceosorus bombacis TaxID=401625 RepID=A0A0P1BDW9_9BASI|nr:Zinc finger, DHHC-type, palmitoyltransferase [Ceraceosorus bombacis]
MDIAKEDSWTTCVDPGNREPGGVSKADGRLKKDTGHRPRATTLASKLATRDLGIALSDAVRLLRRTPSWSTSASPRPESAASYDSAGNFQTSSSPTSRPSSWVIRQLQQHDAAGAGTVSSSTGEQTSALGEIVHRDSISSAGRDHQRLRNSQSFGLLPRSPRSPGGLSGSGFAYNPPSTASAVGGLDRSTASPPPTSYRASRAKSHDPLDPPSGHSSRDGSRSEPLPTVAQEHDRAEASRETQSESLQEEVKVPRSRDDSAEAWRSTARPASQYRRPPPITLSTNFAASTSHQPPSAGTFGVQSPDADQGRGEALSVQDEKSGSVRSGKGPSPKHSTAGEAKGLSTEQRDGGLLPASMSNAGLGITTSSSTSNAAMSRSDSGAALSVGSSGHTPAFMTPDLVPQTPATEQQAFHLDLLPVATAIGVDENQDHRPVPASDGPARNTEPESSGMALLGSALRSQFALYFSSNTSLPLSSGSAQATGGHSASPDAEPNSSNPQLARLRLKQSKSSLWSRMRSREALRPSTAHSEMGSRAATVGRPSSELEYTGVQFWDRRGSAADFGAHGAPSTDVLQEPRTADAEPPNTPLKARAVRSPASSASNAPQRSISIRSGPPLVGLGITQTPERPVSILRRGSAHDAISAVNDATRERLGASADIGPSAPRDSSASAGSSSGPRWSGSGGHHSIGNLSGNFSHLSFVQGPAGGRRMSRASDDMPEAAAIPAYALSARHARMQRLSMIESHRGEVSSVDPASQSSAVEEHDRRRSTRRPTSLVASERPPRSLDANSSLSRRSVDARSSEAEGFAYMANRGPILPNAFQHVDHQVLSAEDFRAMIASIPHAAVAGSYTSKREAVGSTWGKTHARMLCFSLFQVAFAALWGVFEAPYLAQAVHPSVVAVQGYLFLGMMVNFVVALFREPGALPKALDSDPPYGANRAFASPIPGADQDGRTTPAPQNSDAVVLDLDEDSPRRRLAIAKLRQQLRGAAASALPRAMAGDTQAQGSGLQLRVGGTTSENVAKREAQTAESKIRPPKGEQAADQVQSGKWRGRRRASTTSQARRATTLMPLQVETSVRAIPFVDREGQKTWLIYEGDDADRFTRRHRILRPLGLSGKHLIKVVRGQRLAGHSLPPLDIEKEPLPKSVMNLSYHTDWLGSDVGIRNLAAFIGFLIFAFLALSYTVVFAALHLAHVAHLNATEPRPPGLAVFPDERGSFARALRASPISGLLFASGLCFIFLALLPRIYLHLQCALSGETLISHKFRKSIGKRWKVKPPPPPMAASSRLKNALQSLCLPIISLGRTGDQSSISAK